MGLDPTCSVEFVCSPCVCVGFPAGALISIPVNYMRPRIVNHASCPMHAHESQWYRKCVERLEI